MPEGLHGLLIPRSRVRIPPGPTCGPVAQLDRAGPSFQDLVAANLIRMPKRRECRRDYIFAKMKPSRSILVPLPRLRIGGCRLDYMVRAPARAGGRRFNSAPGQPGSSGRSSANPSPPIAPRRGECRRDYMGLQCAGSNPAGLSPVAQRSEHGACPAIRLSPRRLTLSS